MPIRWCYLNKINDKYSINDAQRRAIEHTSGHLLIVAGPGTGKTHTLIQRIIYFLEKFPSQGILAITFTNKAAKELKERLAPPGSSSTGALIFVGTFHSFCLDILRQFPSHTKLPTDFRIASGEEIEALAKECWPEESAGQIRNILEEISRSKSSMSSSVAPGEAARYNQYLRQRGFLDFDDLLQETAALLKNNDSLRVSIQKTYPFVFVDEFQDLNAVQHQLLGLLVGEGVTLTVIGDPNQAIYGFRGSDVRYFETFLTDFPGAATLSLSDNYRSTANILAASGQVIRKSKFAVPALTANIYSQGHLHIFAAATGRAEAEYVVHQIEKIVGGTSMFSQDSGRVTSGEDSRHSFGDIAVLYRLKIQRKILEEAFSRSGIPYQISGEKLPHEESLDMTVEKVNLLTIHAAKGLEFPVVFIIGCEENLLPLRLEGLASDIDEERRLFYVGMSRAKERLYLIRAKKRQLFGKFYSNSASPFLSDIEEALKEYEVTEHKINLKRKQHKDQLQLFK